jgi:methionine-rich copper-binding protein CopC
MVRALGIGMGKLIWIGIVTALLWMPAACAADEETFPVLQIGTRTYTNVTITTKAKTYVFITHSAGMANIKVSEMPSELREQLGFGEPVKPQSGAAAVWAQQKSRIEGPKMKALEKQVQQRWSQDAPALISKVNSLSPTMLVAIFAGVVFFYLFFCYCSMLICQKAGEEPGVLVWLPLLQIFPLLRAAGMSPLWFLAYLLPPLGLAAQILWSIKIAKARNKNLLVSIFLLLPITSFFAFLYLAFSDGAAEKTERSPRRGSEIMSLETA